MVPELSGRGLGQDLGWTRYVKHLGSTGDTGYGDIEKMGRTLQRITFKDFQVGYYLGIDEPG